MGKFKVNSKTGILFCIVLLDTASGLPFKKIDDVYGKTVGGDDSVNISEDNRALLTRIRRELHDSEADKSGDETSDEASASIESRFGFNGRGRNSKPKDRNHGYQFFQAGAEPWNNGHGNKYGHGHHHEFGYNPGHNHHHGCGPNHHEGYGPGHDQGHHNGFENHPWKKPEPGYNYNKPPSGLDGSRPNANGPWDGGSIDKVDKTTTQKTTTLPQIDVRVGGH